MDGIIDSMDMSLSKLQEIVKDMLQSMGSQRVRHDLATEQQQGKDNWPDQSGDSRGFHSNEKTRKAGTFRVFPMLCD